MVRRNKKLQFETPSVFDVYRLKHRGPDWSGLYQHGDCYLAHQRLAIIDPASGDQPLFNEDKAIVVTVGHISKTFTIFNHRSNSFFCCCWICKIDGEVCVEHQVNGEIYNHEELRKSLPNHKFRTDSDCDVIAHLVGRLSTSLLLIHSSCSTIY